MCLSFFAYMTQQIILNRLSAPAQKRLNEDVEWLCRSMGLVKGRDTDETALRLFRAVLFSLAEHRRLTSDGLAEELRIKRAVVNYHLRQFIDAGLLTREKYHLLLRGGSMRRTLLEVKRDADRIFDDLFEIAAEVDAALGIPDR